MSRAVMQQAWEAMSYGNTEEREAARVALGDALAQPADHIADAGTKVEPAAGFQCKPQPAVTEDGFTDWVCPKPLGYLMQCCDCNLIHEVETRVAHYEPRPSENFEVVTDPDTQVQWRMKRRDDLAPAIPQAVPQIPQEASSIEPVWCGCGDGIVADDGAKCGTCIMMDERQPLTDIAIGEVLMPVKLSGDGYYLRIARAIESAHGIGAAS